MPSSLFKYTMGINDMRKAPSQYYLRVSIPLITIFKEESPKVRQRTKSQDACLRLYSDSFGQIVLLWYNLTKVGVISDYDTFQ